VSVEFEPVKLGQRRRRLDPVALGAIAMVVAVVVAVVKPWGAAEDVGNVAGDTQVTAAPQDLTGPHATASVALPRVIQTRSGSGATWAEIEPVISRHEAWGVRAIVIRSRAIDTPLGSKRRLAERWFPLDVDAPETVTAQVDPTDLSIIALGLTFPPAHAPLDVRIWRATTSGLDWIDAAPIDPVPSGGAFLYVRPGFVGGGVRTWGAGTYRIDALVDGRIRRFGMTIPDRFSNVPDLPVRPSLRDQAALPDPAEAVLPDVPIGLFAAVDGVGLLLAGDEGPALDAAAAWLDVDPGTGRPPRAFVGAVYLPRATGLGVMLPPGSVVQSTTLDRLAPEPLPVEPERIEVAGSAETTNQAVLFRAPDGGPWTPGVYRISVVWADAAGLHDRSWHMEFRPGPIGPPSAFLAAARRWARYAGSNGVILGTPVPLESAAELDGIRLVTMHPADATYPVQGSVGCGGTVIGQPPGILGFAYPADLYRSSVNARILRPFLRRDDQVVMTAAFGINGLILAAPGRIANLPAADYEFTVGSGATAIAYNLCLGMQAFDD
jgi:hypothetical protein